VSFLHTAAALQTGKSGHDIHCYVVWIACTAQPASEGAIGRAKRSLDRALAPPSHSCTALALQPAKHRLTCTHADQDRPVSSKLSKIPSGELPEEAGDKAAAVQAPSRKSFGDVTRSARRLLPVSFRQRPLQQQQPDAQPNLPTHHAKPTGDDSTTSLDLCFKFLKCFSLVQQMANLVWSKQAFLRSIATTACCCMIICHAKSS